MKKMICKILSAVMILSTMMVTSVSADEAVPTASTVLVNGEDIKFDSYNINGNNYFKLRDLAYVLNATEKQFSVGYDEVMNTVSLTSSQPYTIVGGELDSVDGDVVEATATNSSILKNGEEVNLQVYLINDSNYFKLRDIGKLFDFGIDWNGEKNIISIDTSKNYISENEGDKVIESTYYSQYQSGDKVEIKGKLLSIEEYRGENGSWDNATLLGHFKDNDDNDWITYLNEDEYGIGHKSDFEKYVGANVTISGTYEGYSKKFKNPFISLYTMKSDSNIAINGIRKVEELLANGQIPIENEFDPYMGGMSIEWMLKNVKHYLEYIKSGYEILE